MGFSINECQQLFELFDSNTNAYGVTIVGNTVNGKAEAKSHLEHKQLTMLEFQRHLEGQLSIGAAPLKDGNVVKWCAIDIDNYVGNLQDIIDAIEDFDLPLIPCYSKSKKLHLYCFFSDEADAADAVALMNWYKAVFRCDPKTEVFPKQTKISSNARFYSWINLPYFNANDSQNHRKGIKKDGTYMSLSEFVERAQEHRFSIEAHWERLKELRYFGAPPCVLSGILLRDVPPGTRNTWFYNVACFLRMDDENADVIEPLLEINESLHTPIPEREIHSTVAKVAGKSYYYQCAGMIGCDKTACKKTDKGIGNNKSTKFSFGQLTKILTDPIQWEWEVNNNILRFASTEAIMNQNIFRKLCMEKINDMPYKVADDKWTSIIRRALENVIEQQVEIFGNFGKGSMFLAAVSRYFGGMKRYTDDLHMVQQNGRVKKDTDNNKYIFNSASLYKVLSEELKEYKLEDIRIKLVELGARQEGGLLWSIPMDAIPIIEQKEEQIDYHDKEGEEENFGF